MVAEKLAFQIGRRIGRHPVAGRLFCLTERLLPLKRIARRDGIVAFHHPRPVADPHVLIVPTRPVASLTSDRLADEEMAELIWRMVELGRELTLELPESAAWQIVINGGKRQDVGQLHGHLMHAESSGLPGPALTSLTTESAVWDQILAQVKEAAEVADNGFSLILRWQSDGAVRAEVTQALHT